MFASSTSEWWCLDLKINSFEFKKDSSLLLAWEVLNTRFMFFWCDYQLLETVRSAARLKFHDSKRASSSKISIDLDELQSINLCIMNNFIEKNFNGKYQVLFKIIRTKIVFANSTQALQWHWVGVAHINNFWLTRSDESVNQLSALEC